MYKKFNLCFVLITVSIAGNGMARFLLVDLAEEKRISDEGSRKLPTEYINGAHKENCGKLRTGIADCTANGDSGAYCVYGDHCGCSYPHFVCDGDSTLWKHEEFIHIECVAGVSCIPSESRSLVKKMQKLQGPSPKRNPSFKAKPAPKAKSGALLLRSGPSPKRNPSFKAKPAPKAKSGALQLRSGPSPKRNPSFKAKPAPKAKSGVW